jgi:hypothetical protein
MDISHITYQLGNGFVYFSSNFYYFLHHIFTCLCEYTLRIIVWLDYGPLYHYVIPPSLSLRK